MMNERFNKGELFLLFLGLLFFFLFLLENLSYPGLHYDEVLYANAALGDIDGSFLYQKAGKIPLFLMPYVGALISYVYFFIFKLWDVSIWSIRLPAIFLMAIALGFYYVLARKYFNRKTALGGLFLLLTNPTFLLMGKTSPVTTIEWILQIGVFYLFWGTSNVWVLAFLMLLGLFNKISFIWWLGGFFFASLVIYQSFWKKNLSLVLVCGGGLLIWKLFIWRTSEWNAGFDLGVGRVEVVWGLLRQVLEGRAFYLHLFGDEPWHTSLYWVECASVGILLVLLSGVILGWMKSSASEVRFVGRNGQSYQRIVFLLLQVGTTFFLVAYTTRADRFWHFVLLLPWIYLLFAHFIGQGNHWGWFLFVGLLLYNANMLEKMWERSALPPAKATWSTAIYPLIEFCQEKPPCVSVDWGTHNQLLAFLQSKEKVWEYSEEKPMQERVHYVAYSRGLWTGPQNKEKFLNRAERLGCGVSLREQIFEAARPVFDVYILLCDGK